MFSDWICERLKVSLINNFTIFGVADTGTMDEDKVIPVKVSTVLVLYKNKYMLLSDNSIIEDPDLCIFVRSGRIRNNLQVTGICLDSY